MYNQADALWMLGRENEPLQTYDKAIQEAPDYAEAYINKGWMLEDVRAKKRPG